MVNHTSAKHKVLTFYYGIPCHIYTSHREGNINRTFYRHTNNSSPKDCNFFKWVDDYDKQLLKVNMWGELNVI